MNKSIFSVLLALILLTSCGKKDYLVTIKTPYGDMVAILYDETPKHKENFIKLTQQKFFDSLLFHRVIPGFMIQGGDPDSRNAEPGQALGNGGPGYTIDAEFSPNLFHQKGALAAARLGDQTNPAKASSGSQFYIVEGTVVSEETMGDLTIDQVKMNEGFRQLMMNPNNKPLMDSLNVIYMAGDMAAYKKKIFSLTGRIEKETGMKVTKYVSPEKIKAYTTAGGAPHLDDGYTVFGQVIKGLEVINKIAMLERDGNNRPLNDVRTTVTIEEMSRTKITKEYGYEYPAEKK